VQIAVALRRSEENDQEVRYWRDGGMGEVSNFDRESQKVGANIATSVGQARNKKETREDKMMRRRNSQGIIGRFVMAPDNERRRGEPLNFERSKIGI
jgi:predicted AAA+ superfamily ATPase